MAGIGLFQIDSARISLSQVALERETSLTLGQGRGRIPPLAVNAYTHRLQGLALSNGQHASHNHASNNCTDSIDNMTKHEVTIEISIL